MLNVEWSCPFLWELNWTELNWIVSALHTVDEMDTANAIVAGEEAKETNRPVCFFGIQWLRIPLERAKSSNLERMDGRTKDSHFAVSPKKLTKKPQTKHNTFETMGMDMGMGYYYGYFIFLSRLIQSIHIYVCIRKEWADKRSRSSTQDDTNAQTHTHTYEKERMWIWNSFTDNFNSIEGSHWTDRTWNRSSLVIHFRISFNNSVSFIWHISCPDK